jgi:dihydroflavonol-4-reductase
MLVGVTGASGYVAGHVIAQLLERGYRVRGTVRSVAADKVAHLREKFPALELVEADLLEEGSFDAFAAGCDYIQHTASPFVVANIVDPQKELIVCGCRRVVCCVVQSHARRVRGVCGRHRRTRR